jgi:hypothetical protein
MASSLKEMGNIKDFRAQLESKKFCFCLPVRLGVFVRYLSQFSVQEGELIRKRHPGRVADHHVGRVHHRRSRLDAGLPAT